MLTLEFIASALLVLGVLGVLVWRILRGRPIWLRAGVLGAALGGYVAVSLVYSTSLEKPVDESTVSNRPFRKPHSEFVGSETCRSCHPHHHETWHDSYHRTMTQVATPESVLGDFDGVELKHADLHYRLERDGDKFYVDVTGGDRRSSRDRREIVMTTGSHHMQVYWYDSGDGRETGQLPFVYLLDEKRWIPRNAAFLRAPTVGRGDEKGRWNQHCINCHSTQGVWAPQVNETLEKPDTYVAEFGISCEACHGPGAEHVALNRDPSRRYRMHLAGAGDPSAVQPQKIGSGLSSQVCGQCHAMIGPASVEDFEHRSLYGDKYRAGKDLTDTRLVFSRDPVTHTEVIKGALEADPFFLDDRFWSDGMVRVSGREYSAMLGSTCHTNGEMSCLSCHTMHQDLDDPRPRKEWANDQLNHTLTGNMACTQCHEEFAEDAGLAAHTHHPVGSSGSSCYNCHMPHTTFGLLKAIRSHTIDSPSVRTSIISGRPNACNLCHLDQTLEWTRGYLRDWYDLSEPPLDEENQTVAASLLWLLKGDAGQRALLAWHMGWEEARATSDPGWMAPHLAQLLDDPYKAVRYISHRSLKSLPGVPQSLIGNYDFLAPPHVSRPAIEATIASWQQWNAGRDRSSWPAGVLVRPDGAPDFERVRAIQFERDDTRIKLAE